MKQSTTLVFIIALALLEGVALTPATADLRPPDPNKLNDRQRERASELFKQLKETPDDQAKRTEIVKEMTELGRGVAQKMFDILDRQWKPKFGVYRQAFTAATRKAAAAKSTGSAKQEIARLEKQVQALRGKGNLSKDLIKKVGDPALKRLKELKILTIEEILAADPNLSALRDEMLAVVQQRDYCIDQLVLLDDEAQPFGSKDLQVFEGQIAASALGPPAEDLAVLGANERLKGKVPDAAIDAIRDMNLYRTLIGLRPCAIDPRLCVASLGHSTDMAEKNFFAHDSPVPGKESPGKRAALAGTSWSGENIFMGSSRGSSANKAWWYSPGHHKNMLAPGQRRAGMGVYKRRWTQMFGR